MEFRAPRVLGGEVSSLESWVFPRRCFVDALFGHFSSEADTPSRPSADQHSRIVAMTLGIDALLITVANGPEQRCTMDQRPKTPVTGYAVESRFPGWLLPNADFLRNPSERDRA